MAYSPGLRKKSYFTCLTQRAIAVMLHHDASNNNPAVFSFSEHCG